MKKIVFLLITAIMFVTNAKAFDVRLLASNKEVNSRELTKKDLLDLQKWIKNHTLKGDELRGNALKALDQTIQEEVRIDTSCELGIVTRFANHAKELQLITESDELSSVLVYLRNEHLIDDILYKILKKSVVVNIEIAKRIGDRRPTRPATTRSPLPKVDLNDLYAPFKSWPDDTTNCSIDTYYRMMTKLTWNTTKERDLLVQRLNYKAVQDGVIDMPTYNMLETFRNLAVLEWPIYFKRYADMINNAKDRLTLVPEERSTYSMPVISYSRKVKVTRRERLYTNFNSTQVMMMAQLIEKTAKRMDAKEVSLHFRYTDGPNSETEIYIFSPMEQYRAAIKMLKKEMAELMRSDAFRHSGLEYDDLIAAAYETGFVKSEELEHVLKFEDFWNPNVPRWKTYAGYAFSIAGTATFYLPPPWNIAGAVALILTQSKIMNKDKEPDADDNWNVII